MLSVHGQRGDGFHSLTSVVAPLKFGDTLWVELSDENDFLECSDAAVPVGEGNLVMQAAATFRLHFGKAVFFKFRLEKRIPMGAGLGGGSSNAAVALLAMNRLCGEFFSRDQLRVIAAELGSDCALFIDRVASLVRGRGEMVEPMSIDWQRRLEGQPLVLFRPNFPIETKWAYGRLIQANGAYYEAETRANVRLAEAKKLNELLFNSFEAAVGSKYVTVPVLLMQLRAEGFDVLMSGSGSCCFGFLPNDEAARLQMQEIVRDAWGMAVFWIETYIHQPETE